ncbi:putative signal peptidase complex subunit 2 [Citrus sinensis]|uniref:Signal peptidase complex subunit 2 n=1 Tax=Citrus sinensis TaxID=2711 RepID=A0ACB8L116_CITSI|nr:putative signal peptidase complex subunit 2 [Citrus sinensis]
MQEKKSSSTSTEMANKNPKKANLLDHHSIKHILDESVSEIVTSRGYVEDVRMSNVRLLLGTIIIAIALVAQFYKKKFPENRDFLIGPASLVCIFGILLVHANCVSVLHKGSFTSTGLVVSSKLPRFSDLYTLTVASADPKSISAGQPVEFTKSVTQWFAKDGVLVEGLFWKDVFALLDEYAIEPKKKK